LVGPQIDELQAVRAKWPESNGFFSYPQILWITLWTTPCLVIPQRRKIVFVPH
jgi:hypothetical protein